MTNIKTSVLLGLLVILCGCGGGKEEAQDHGAEDAHDHPSHGPHGGELIELGEHVAHMEVVHDEKAGTVSVFFIDEKMKSLDITKAPQLNISSKNGPLQLTATSVKGSSSDWVFQDDALRSDPKMARFRVVVNGVTYSPDMPAGHDDHDHGNEGGDDHEGHDH